MGVLAGQSDNEHVGLPQPPLCSHGCPPAVSLLRDVRIPQLRLQSWLPHLLLPLCLSSYRLSRCLSRRISSYPQPSWFCCHQGCRRVGKFPGDQRENGGEYYRFLTVKGEFTIQQNGLFDIFSGGDAKFNAYIMSSTDLTGTNVYVKLGTGATCAAAITAASTTPPAT